MWGPNLQPRDQKLHVLWTESARHPYNTHILDEQEKKLSFRTLI